MMEKFTDDKILELSEKAGLGIDGFIIEGYDCKEEIIAFARLIEKECCRGEE